MRSSLELDSHLIEPTLGTKNGREPDPEDAGPQQWDAPFVVDRAWLYASDFPVA